MSKPKIKFPHTHSFGISPQHYQKNPTHTQFRTQKNKQNMFEHEEQKICVSRESNPELLLGNNQLEKAWKAIMLPLLMGS